MTSDTVPPPVNNACLPDIFNKLDADVIERTKVINKQLSFRLQVQEKVFLKYKNAAEQRFALEKDKLRADLRNICRRLPNYADLPHLESKTKMLYRRKPDKCDKAKGCVSTNEQLETKGICTEKEDKPFCDRYFTHHLPTKSRFYRQSILGSVKKGMSMPDLRPKPRDRLVRLEPRQPYRKHIKLTSDMLPLNKALDDNFIIPKSHLQYESDDDETRTV